MANSSERGRPSARRRTAHLDDFVADRSAGPHSRLLCWLSIAISSTFIVLIVSVIGYGFSHQDTKIGDGYVAPGGRLLLSAANPHATCVITAPGQRGETVTLTRSSTKRLVRLWDGQVVSPPAGARITCAGDVVVIAGPVTWLAPLGRSGFLIMPLLIWAAVAATLLVRRRRRHPATSV